MTQDYSVVRCPICGSINLQACYDDSANKRVEKSGLLFGWLGLLVSLKKNKNTTSTFWECQSCGHIFPME